MIGVIQVVGFIHVKRVFKRVRVDKVFRFIHVKGFVKVIEVI